MIVSVSVATLRFSATLHLLVGVFLVAARWAFVFPAIVAKRELRTVATGVIGLSQNGYGVRHDSFVMIRGVCDDCMSIMHVPKNTRTDRAANALVRDPTL